MASQDRRDPDFNQMENENSEQQIAWVCNILQKEAERSERFSTDTGMFRLSQRTIGGNKLNTGKPHPRKQSKQHQF